MDREAYSAYNWGLVIEWTDRFARTGRGAFHNGIRFCDGGWLGVPGYSPLHTI